MTYCVDWFKWTADCVFISRQKNHGFFLLAIKLNDLNFMENSHGNDKNSLKLDIFLFPSNCSLYTLSLELSTKQDNQRRKHTKRNACHCHKGHIATSRLSMICQLIHFYDFNGNRSVTIIWSSHTKIWRRFDCLNCAFECFTFSRKAKYYESCGWNAAYLSFCCAAFAAAYIVERNNTHTRTILSMQKVKRQNNTEWNGIERM